jgi:hypothetical protein
MTGHLDQRGAVAARASQGRVLCEGVVRGGCASLNSGLDNKEHMNIHRSSGVAQVMRD